VTGYPLMKPNRIKLARAFKNARRVDLSIDCAIEGQMGKAFADDAVSPTVFEIELGHLFCYFAGNAASVAGCEMIKSLPSYRMLMPSTPGWLEVAQEVHGDRLSKLARYSFSSGNLSIDHLKCLLAGSPFRDRIRRIDVGTARQLSNSLDSIFEISDFESVEDFAERSIGYYLMDGDAMMGVAYSSLVCSKGIEVSVFVTPEHRRNGVATCLASALIQWCLENNVDPHWDAANVESYGLAEKLSYAPIETYDAYFLRGTN
jgi:GNAT superfamily N-acetyltransferase